MGVPSGELTIAAESRAALESVPGTTMSGSSAAIWNSVLVCTWELPMSVEAFEKGPTPDQSVVLVTRGHLRFESFSGGMWRGAECRPGFVRLTAGGHANRIRWHSTDAETIETVHIYFPRTLVDATYEEYRRANAPRGEAPAVLLFEDPTSLHVCTSLANAARVAAPELYAQSAAQFAVAHLISLQNRRTSSLEDERHIGTLGRRRLAAVLEFMAVNFAKPLTLDELAREANVSRFHFVQLFRREVGVTPHQHLILLRLDAAARMLSMSDASVQLIARACGYSTSAHFAKSFAQRYGVTPSSYRLHATETLVRSALTVRE